MAKATTISSELKNAIVWLERQPGVLSVVQARYTRARHHHKPGFTRVRIADDKQVHVVCYDAKGVKDLFVHAKPGPWRDAWVARLATGDVLSSINGAPVAVKSKLVLPEPPGPSIATTKPIEGKVISAEFGKLYQVTPELATQWLERNTRNRKLRQSHVNKYAAAMKAGRWYVSPDAIGFDRNGAVINGQHRLWAVIEASVTVPMYVVTGLDPDTIKVLDDHLKRSLSDVAAIHRPGTTISTLHCAVAKMLIKTNILATSLDRNQAMQRIDREQELDALERHMEAIEFAFRECFRSAKAKGIVVTGVLTPIARAWYTQDRSRLKEFGAVMHTGLVQSAADSSAITLRNWLLRMAQGSTRHIGDVVYGKTERALQAFLKGERITNLYEASSELFPLPEEGRGKPKA